MPVYEVKYSWQGSKFIQAYTPERAEAILEETYLTPGSRLNDELEELVIHDVAEVGDDEADAELREDSWLEDFVDPAID